MCVSIVFGANLAEGKKGRFEDRVMELGHKYEYGTGIGISCLHAEAGPAVVDSMSAPDVVFELHDLSEHHCACDIDQDIRNGSRNGVKSKFFDFTRELMEFEGINSLSVMFFQDEYPGAGTTREHFGTFDEFIQLINRWNTWQVEGFEPTRRAYFVADASPFMYTFTDIKLPN